MITTLLHLLRLWPFLCGGHRQLALEKLALRQQLAVYKRTASRPKLRWSDRLLWIWLSRVWTGWRDALVIVAPDTVLRWRRRRFRDHWTNLSGRPTVGRPPVSAEIIALVKKMAEANPLWGAPRIHGELSKLGIDVAERTVSRLIPKRRTPPSQTWRTFLTNHVRDLVSIDFFTVPTAYWRVLLELLERLAALVPAPRRPLLAYHSLLAPHAAWRSAIVPAPAAGAAGPSGVAGPDGPRPPGRLSWATLLRRVFSLDVLVCPRCARPRRILGAVTEPHAVRRLLAS